MWLTVLGAPYIFSLRNCDMHHHAIFQVKCLCNHISATAALNFSATSPYYKEENCAIKRCAADQKYLNEF